MRDNASLPPGGLPGLDPRWSRIVAVPGTGIDAGVMREWHCLDTGAELARRGVEPEGTILAVHGNPTWSYLWRDLLAQSLRLADEEGPAWRVVAVDQLDMGFSERTGTHRPLAQRVADLGAFTDALNVDGPVVTLGHDWGGVVSLGWAVDHPASLAGVMLLNTAVHHPDGVPIPFPLRIAGARGLMAGATVATPAFLDTTLSLASPALDAETRTAYRMPYLAAARRRAIGGFVADIPADVRHRSRRELDRIAAEVGRLDVPALLLWGPEDPVFGDRHLDDLIDRLPQADVHRFEGAGHLLAEDRPYAPALLAWLRDHGGRPARVHPTSPRAVPERTGSEDSASPPFAPLWHRLDERRDDDDIAIVEMSRAGSPDRRVSWRQFHDRVQRLAAGLYRVGVRKGDRVSLLVEPGPTLSAIVYACLRIGAVVVVADAGLGVRGLTRAVRGAWPDVIIGGSRGLAAARVLGWPGIRISAARLPKAAAAALGVSFSLSDILREGTGAPLPDAPGAGDAAAVLFTSGSTGPAKGVAYTHEQLSALRDVLAAHFQVTSDTGLVTGFAPFALLGPALGTRSVTPDMDVSAPRTLTARAVAAAVRASAARVVFLSPAAILNVVDTAGALTVEDRAALAGVETFLSTGAPISARLLESVAALMPNATPHTPYGMTECLLVTDITLPGVHDAADSPDTGVCVGSPIGSNRVRVSALDRDGRATGAPSEEPGVVGEIVISAPHLKDHYDRLWLTDQEAMRDTGDLDPAVRWHRTGDVGHLDRRGRLWVEGRTQHVIVTEDDPVAPVGPEQGVERVDAVRRAAVVGVGPHGLRQAVAVVETIPPTARAGLAAPEITRGVRAAAGIPLAAVLTVPRLPTDIRHNSKIDRSKLSVWAERILAGERPFAP
ncbi:alpha/beta fold hydrolase [Microbacterium yannicii]|uniref:alpha/beta fold hydrolase n=1 Tax=Microbacterium yannicii TaxID=671622 RepID=UPI0002E05A9A